MDLRKAAAHSHPAAAPCPAGEVRDLLGGQVTISGLYERVGRADLNVVIVTLASPPADAPDNQHTLPQPFADAKHKGSILLFRNDEDAKPVDFTLADYAALQEAKAGEEQPAAAAAGAEQVEDEDDEEESDEEDEDEEGLSEDQQAMLQAVIGNFTQMKGRPPSEIELVAIMNQLNQRIVEAESEDDSDCDEEELAAENDAEAQDGDEDDEESEEESEAEEEEEEMAPPAAAAAASATRGPRKGARQSVEGTPGLRRGKGAATAPAPPAPIIRKSRRAAAAN